MPGFVGRLEAGEALDATPHFKGPWRRFERTRLADGGELSFDATDCEHAVFVMSGTGRFNAGGASGTFTAGSTFTIGWQAELTLSATTACEFFVTTLEVSAP